ncbi:MAG: type I-C CRISPR-associated protein Cas8c/Csd1 [Bacillota bacterium]|nr:type I-C CRISPR-associated protein Cas8c/Csd1 [Bacillota bacterium]
MSWIEELALVYDNNREYVAMKESDGSFLLPLYHSINNAQVEVTISGDGEFLGAEEVVKEDEVTIIPVTMDSAGRSSGIAPHPLCDYCQYVKTKSDDKTAEYHEAYMKQLAAWKNSPHSHDKVEAIYAYLSKGCLIGDILRTTVLSCGENNLLTDRIKVRGTKSPELFIRFRVEGKSQEARTWADKELFESFIGYMKENAGVQQLCYVSGRVVACAEKHPSKIRYSGDSARLISGNDENGLIYRGRFRTKSEVFSLGYELSEKAHCALKWLLKRQGWHRDTLHIMCWESNLTPLPPLLASTDKVFENWQDFGAYEDDEDEKYPQTGQSFSLLLNQAIKGYREPISPQAKIIVMALDGASSAKGRIAMTLYRELLGSKFFENLQNWHTTMAWYFWMRKGKNMVNMVAAPSPERIATCLYGTEQGDIIKVKDEAIKFTVDRLMPCIIEARPLPLDMSEQAVAKASSPQSYEKSYNWEEVVSVACALVRKSILDKKEECPMSLDVKNTDRSYLYGRLLAVADVLEASTFARGEERQTNAKRYMNAFSTQPYVIWKVIEERLQPYLDKLSTGYRIRCEKLLDEIFDLFEYDGFTSNKKLEGSYLLGYHTQKRSLFTKEEKE